MSLRKDVARCFPKLFHRCIFKKAGSNNIAWRLYVKMPVKLMNVNKMNKTSVLSTIILLFLLS